MTSPVMTPPPMITLHQRHSPKDSPNTDGVGLNCAGGVDAPCVLRNSVIYNGDDEVAVGGTNVLVEDCEFGSGMTFGCDWLCVWFSLSREGGGARGYS